MRSYFLTADYDEGSNDLKDYRKLTVTQEENWPNGKPFKKDFDSGDPCKDWLDWLKYGYNQAQITPEGGAGERCSYSSSIDHLVMDMPLKWAGLRIAETDGKLELVLGHPTTVQASEQPSEMVIVPEDLPYGTLWSDYVSRFEKPESDAKV